MCSYFVPEQQGVTLSSSVTYAHQSALANRTTRAVVIGKTQTGKNVTASMNNTSIPQDFLRGEHRHHLKEALSTIPVIRSSTTTCVLDTNFTSAAHAIGMIHDSLGNLERLWYKVTLADGQEGVLPFAKRGARPDLAQIRLHLQGSHLIRAVLRTDVLARIPRGASDPLCEYWRNNLLVKKPEFVIKRSSKPVSAPSWY